MQINYRNSYRKCIFSAFSVQNFTTHKPLNIKNAVHVCELHFRIGIVFSVILASRLLLSNLLPLDGVGLAVVKDEEFAK